ncbi:hypothetical protein [Umezawaea sp. NPDC059074]|uniref:hypothetical protein n=1 Tax=Umezawaea sp. NPDC059074 TaxID=3346716 RepID=UPI00369145DF
MKQSTSLGRAHPTQAQREEGTDLLRKSVTKSKRKEQVPFAKDFLRTSDCAPPLARLIQGGRGGEVRLKLFLTITMMATSSPYDIGRPPTPDSWARRLAVTGAQPARRVADSLRWLHKEGFIRLTPRKGATPQITLLTPQPSGVPSEEYTRPVGRYISLPLGLWTNGWIIDMPATSLVLMMVIRDVQQARDAFRYVPSDERAMYGLSADTWTRARNDLQRRDLLEVKRVPQGGEFDYRRMRNLYRVRLEQLGSPSLADHQLPPESAISHIETDDE